MYYVWRRGDGYVNATTYDPNNGQLPNLTFETLLKTEDWSEASAIISREREKVS